MSGDPFFTLKEIDSLNKMKLNHLKAKSDQEDRVSKLKTRLEEAHLQTATLKQELISTTNDLANVEELLKTASEQKQRLIDIGGDDKKILNFASDIEKYEEQGLEFLSRLEEIEGQLTDQKTFRAGVENTIREISDEIQPEIEKIEQEVKNIDMRLSLLDDELPSDFKSIYHRVSAKKLAHGPFTKTDQGSCYMCRFKISKLDESEIDAQRALKTCPQCGRIFLPYENHAR